MRLREGIAQDSWRFHIVKPLGSGGFGTVYEAVDYDTGKRVALKELTRVSPASLVRFKQEFRALSDVHHPNLVSIRELIEQDGRWYIVMELIEGRDLIEFVRSSEAELGFDEGGLRQAFLGVARGLHALHRYGLMHRDLKPANVRVTREGRAVLLDFGLATSLDSNGQSTQAHCVGTPLYMAPEQLAGHKLERSADWYAFGTCLYEALTGRLPFEGALPVLVAHEKQTLEPAHPRELVAGLPEDLSALCVALLQRTALLRPTGDQVLEMLGLPQSSERSPTVWRASLPPVGRLFAGRHSELEHLERALARTDEGELHIVLVEGESGVGKSELVAHFLREQLARDPRTLVLRGRCYENEQVSYKAFDGCVDALAGALKRLGPDADALIPPDASQLAQMFPVLADVPSIARTKDDRAAADLTARRLQAFAALAALLVRLAEERPLILAIDDLQWADAESFRLLRALAEAPRSPPLLMLCTVRPRVELDVDVRTQLETIRLLQCVDVVPIVGLPRPQAEQLARSLLGPGADSSWASTIAIESRGHPLFLGELVHFSQSRDLGAAGTITLEAALTARIERLPSQARALLELVSLAGRPHRVELFAEALGVESLDEEVSGLRSAQLLRERRDGELICFHDRIRHVTVSMIASPRLPFLHMELARALQNDADADPAEQAGHWDLANAREPALDAYERAADQALATLAFVHAERLYARALELVRPEADERYLRLMTGRADALGFSGRSAEAARLYQRAAELTAGEEQSLRLRSKTAQHLMLSGELSAGMVAARQLLKGLGISLPESDLAALLRALWDRVCLGLRGYAMPREQPLADSRAELVLELVNELQKAFAILRTSAYLALSGQYMRRSLALGSAYHAAQAFANEAWLRCARGSFAAGSRFFERSRALCARGTAPGAAALLAQQEGSALVASWDWVRGVVRLEEAERLYQAHAAHDPWSLTVVRYMLGATWFRLGRHALLAEKMEAWIGEAHERRDRVAVALLSGMGHGSARHLRRGAPDEALRELEDAIAAVPAEPFSFTHLGHLLGTTQALNLVSARAAWDWLEGKREQLSKPFLLKTRFGRDALALLRGIAALRACEGASASERKRLLSEVSIQASWLGQQTSGYTRACATYFRAQAAALEGRPEEGLELARAAHHGFERVGYTGAHGCAYLEGLLEGGRSGAARCAASLESYREQGWVDPEQALVLVLPALPALRERRALPAGDDHRFIRHYEVLAPLGTGGLGAVFEAREVRSGRAVALKQLVGKGARSLERFKREFRALSDLNHPNLVRFDALFEHRGTWYIAMELVRGESLTDFVRPQGRSDPERLRRAFRGLLAGVQALHEAGFVHRDICPSNICVTPEGRAVLLDFGLIARIHDSQDASPVGNAEYAAPEQVEGAVPDASADVFGLGSCLYEALTGKPPLVPSIAGGASTVQRTPLLQALDAPDLHTLSECIEQMLARHPAQRPPLSEVVATLTAERAPRRSLPRSLSLVPDVAPLTSFQGRVAELGRLHAAYAASRQAFNLVLVAGESGLGKSALCVEFVRQLQRAHPELCVLGSRCYENELLPLKAFDGMADQLAALLRTLTPAACQEVLPRKAALLAQLFPVLDGVLTIAKASKKGLSADPAARRRLALDCFIELLERLNRQRPLLLVVDDLQWADLESMRLLAALCRRGTSLPLLIVCTIRPRAELSPETASELDELKTLACTVELPLRELDHDDAVALSASLLGGLASADQLQRLGEESNGHPLFLRELIEHARTASVLVGAGHISLDEAVRSRIERAEPEARTLIRLLALAGRPHPAQLLAAAMGCAELPTESVKELLSLGLLRRRGELELTCYHDRIRYVALADTTQDERRLLAGKLASALEATHGSEPAERARLWLEAGEPERAMRAFEAAGDAALEKLAFQAADQHYARALELTGDALDARWRRLLTQRGHALVQMGKNAHAAQFYTRAAEQATGEERVRLRVWAAQNLIQGAQVEQGLSAAAELFGELGVPFARTPGRARARVLWESARLKLRGVELNPREPLAASRKLALDALNDLSQPVASVMFSQGAALSAQHVRYALDAGEPAHAACALAYEAMLRSTRSPRGDHGALFARARELAEQAGEPAVMAAVEVRHGIACIASDDYETGRDSLLRGHDIAAQCAGQPWLLTNARMQLGVARYVLGEHALLRSSLDGWLRDAKQREDLYAHAALAGYGFGFLRHLMHDDSATALAELEDALRPWRHGLFSTNHFGEVMGNVHSLAYAGGDGALRWLEQNQQRLADAIILRNPIFKVTICNMRIVAALCAAEGAGSERSRSLCGDVKKQASILRQIGSPLSRGFAALWTSSVDAVAGGASDSALHSARDAQRILSRSHKAYGLAALYWEGWLEGGSSGRDKCARALACLSAAGWRSPARYVGMLLPAIRIVPQSR